MLTISTDGIFDSPLYVAAGYAFLFVLFGNFFVMMGGGQLFFDVAAVVTGRMIGGPAKACVVSSGLYGSISGSPVADVATTGPVSIPIMVRLGLPAANAAAIETAASCGGSMLPPVMGAVAFMMADFTGIPYARIALYALMPALIYYAGIMILVHFEARTLGIGRLPAERDRRLSRAFAANWPSLIPIGVLMWLLMARLFAVLHRGGLDAVGAGRELAEAGRRHRAAALRRRLRGDLQVDGAAGRLGGGGRADHGLHRADRAVGQVHAAAVPAFGRATCGRRC